METRIVVNGREYRSVDEMPPDVRQQYERINAMLADRNGNGVPDAFEGQSAAAGDGMNRTFISKTSTRYVVNGREYDRLDDVPPEFRAAINISGPHAHGPISIAAPHARNIVVHLTWPVLLTIAVAAVLVGLVIWAVVS